MDEPLGARYNKDKPSMHLLPWDALLELAHHFAIGSAKYPERNWEKGLKWSEGCAASLMRHLARWQQGENIDPENGQPHVVAIAWNAIVLLALCMRNIGEDDRPSKPAL